MRPGRPRTELGPAETDSRLETEQQNPPSLDATAHSEDGAESTRDGSGEAEEA